MLSFELVWGEVTDGRVLARLVVVAGERDAGQERAQQEHRERRFAQQAECPEAERLTEAHLLAGIEALPALQTLQQLRPGGEGVERDLALAWARGHGPVMSERRIVAKADALNPHF